MKGNNMTEKKGWYKYLENDVYSRLGDCQNLKSDIPLLLKAKWLYYVEIGKDKKGFTKEDALISVLEHLDCNGQYFDLSKEEYDELIEE